MEHQLAEALKISIVELVSLVGPLIVIGLILGLMERQANKYFFAAFGVKGVLATAWLGTPVHEFGHALMCLVFGHKIRDIRLLTIHRTDGTLGYVSHSYNQRSVYQTAGNFFIGIAPIISGIGALFLGLYFLLPNSFKFFEVYIHAGMLDNPFNLTFVKGFAKASLVLIQNLFSPHNLVTLRFWIFLVMAISVSSHMALSWADIKGAVHGLTSLYIVLFILTIISNSIGVNVYRYTLQVNRFNAHMLMFSILALICSLFTLGLSFMVYHIKIRQLS
ncbi:hypothetical protein [Desulfosporosinus sp. SB140]|uniref:hypothetical protein n=1 Tax=Desulfosporosinus paludis TaxID=3115649 RepID=UPI00388DC150